MAAAAAAAPAAAAQHRPERRIATRPDGGDPTAGPVEDRRPQVSVHRRPPPARDHRQLRAACTGSTGRMLAAERAARGRPESAALLCVMPIYFPQHDTQVSPRRGCRTRYGRVYPSFFVLACRACSAVYIPECFCHLLSCACLSRPYLVVIPYTVSQYFESICEIMHMHHKHVWRESHECLARRGAA